MLAFIASYHTCFGTSTDRRTELHNTCSHALVSHNAISNPRMNELSFRWSVREESDPQGTKKWSVLYSKVAWTMVPCKAVVLPNGMHNNNIIINIMVHAC